MILSFSYGKLTHYVGYFTISITFSYISNSLISRGKLLSINELAVDQQQSL